MSLNTQMKCIALFAAGVVLFIGAGAESLSSKGNSRTEIISVMSETVAAVTSVTVPNTTIQAETVLSVISSLSDHTTAAATVTEAVPVHININTATVQELVLLNGIGKQLAEEIVAYRERNGYFRNIEEIVNVSGIGSKLFQRICADIYVDDPIYPEEYDAPEDYPINYEEEQIPANFSIEIEPSEPERRLEDCVPIDLNTADLETLMLLPYVEEDTAEHIIRIREQIGGFSHVYELLIAEELTQEQVAEILQYVCVENETTSES